VVVLARRRIVREIQFLKLYESSGRLEGAACGNETFEDGN
jgi:hypothetical protein